MASIIPANSLLRPSASRHSAQCSDVSPPFCVPSQTSSSPTAHQGHQSHIHRLVIQTTSHDMPQRTFRSLKHLSMICHLHNTCLVTAASSLSPETIGRPLRPRASSTLRATAVAYDVLRFCYKCIGVVQLGNGFYHAGSALLKPKIWTTSGDNRFC